VAGAENVGIVQPKTTAEDFSFFAREVPGFYFQLGAVRQGNTSGGHHTPTFRADDEAIPVGVRAMTGVVLEALEAGS
jgi:amidohydrolase